MPLSRYKIINEYGLGSRELYRTADHNEPEAVLEGVAMAGLVGILRQLGDLAEFAAEVFHGLHDEVMSAAARGHGLMLRVQQLEAELPQIEKDSCQKDYLYVASNRGVDWHADVKVEHGLVTRGDMPHFIMESIQQCHGPPKLFMLDKYDIGGEGACLKRYTNPSFFNTDSACSSMLQEDVHGEKRPLKVMEIRPNLQNYEIFKPPNVVNTDSKLDMDVSGQASDEIPQRRRQLKYRLLNGSVFRTLRPQMQNLYEKDSSEHKAHSMDYSDVKISFTDSPDSNTEVRDIAVDASGDMEKPPSKSPTKQEIKSCIMSKEEDHHDTIPEDELVSDEALSRSLSTPEYQAGFLPDVESEAAGSSSSNGYTSEVDIYVDALTTMESEVETDSENKERRRRAFVRMESGKTCSDTHEELQGSQGDVAKELSSSFRKKDSPTPYYSDVASVNGDEEDVAIPILRAKPVVCEHERTSSLEELLARDLHSSDPDMREQAASDSCPTESTSNGIVSNVTSNGTLDRTKKTKENSNIPTISFKKTASKKSKYSGSGELKPRKLSKKHDPFSHSLRNMAKQLLELKYDSTEDTDSHDLEQYSEEYDVKCLEMSHPLGEIKVESSVIHKVPSDSVQEDDDSRECPPEEANVESEYVVAPIDSLADRKAAHIESNLDLQQIREDPLPDENDFQGSEIVCSMDMASPCSREEVCTSGMRLTSDVLDHDLTNGLVQIEAPSDGEATEEADTEPSSLDASDLEGELEEHSLYDELADLGNANESNEADTYAALDDESAEYVEEQVVSDGIISSPSSSKQSDDACKITPLVLTDTDAGNGIDESIPETEGVLSAQTIAETDLPTVAPESVISTDGAVPDKEQGSLHLETTVLQNTKAPSHGEVVISNYEFDIQHEQPLPLESVPILAAPESTVRPIRHEPYQSSVSHLCNSSSTEICGDTFAPDSRDLPSPHLSSFAWMLNGATQQPLKMPSAEPARETLQENDLSKDTEDAPPLPPLPPMQWRAAKLQIGPADAFGKLGRPPRPKPPVKHRVSESNSSPCVRTQEAEMVQARSQHDSSAFQKEMAQTSVSNESSYVDTTHQNEISTNPFLEPSVEDSNENYDHEASRESENTYGHQIFRESRSSENVASSEDGNAKTSELPELTLDSEDTVSELVEKKPRLEEEQSPSFLELAMQKEDHQHQLSNGVSSHDDAQHANLSTRQKNEEYESSDHQEKELSAVIEEELADMIPPPVPKLPRYPLFEVTSHDRSMLRKAPTLIQPSTKLADERNTLLEQIKNKSFNLKPVLARRPNVMGGPRTNLNVVAILERANAIRQAVADDDDSWSE